jgi:hypothetical protein
VSLAARSPNGQNWFRNNEAMTLQAEDHPAGRSGGALLPALLSRNHRQVVRPWPRKRGCCPVSTVAELAGTCAWGSAGKPDDRDGAADAATLIHW